VTKPNESKQIGSYCVTKTEIGNAWQVFEWPTSKLGKSNT